MKTFQRHITQKHSTERIKLGMADVDLKFLVLWMKFNVMYMILDEFVMLKRKRRNSNVMDLLLAQDDYDVDSFEVMGRLCLQVNTMVNTIET